MADDVRTRCEAAETDAAVTIVADASRTLWPVLAVAETVIIVEAPARTRTEAAATTEAVMTVDAAACVTPSSP